MAVLDVSSTSPSHTSFISYINPVRLTSAVWEAVRGVFQRPAPSVSTMSADPLLVVQLCSVRGLNLDMCVLAVDDPVADTKELLDRATNAYTVIVYRLDDGTELPIAKTFLSDIKRIGNPDQFFIDGIEITQAETSELEMSNLLRKLLRIAGGDKEKLQRWTEIWNHRIRSNVLDLVNRECVLKFNCKPVFRSGDFEVVRVAFNTADESLVCEIGGTLEDGIIQGAGEDDMPELTKCPCSYSAFIRATPHSVEKRAKLIPISSAFTQEFFIQTTSPLDA